MRDAPMSTDEFETPAKALAAPRAKGADRALAAEFNTAVKGSWLSVITLLMTHLPDILRLLDQAFNKDDSDTGPGPANP